MIGPFILGMLLLVQPLVAQDSNAPPNPQSAQEIEQQTEEQIEQSIDEEVIEQRIEEQIPQVMGAGDGPFSWPGVLIAVLNPLGFFTLVGLMAWIVYRWHQARTQARMEFHRQLLEKFDSGREFSEFLESKGSQRLLEGLWSEKITAKERILQSTRWGVVLTVVGAGGLALSWQEEDLLIPGMLILALGLGFLVSTAISYRLSSKLGLLRDEESATESDRTSLS